jgi:nucleotide-binding universal stress UspA family protein
MRIDELNTDVREFCEHRDWEQYHTPKDLAIGLTTESSELLELSRFKDREEQTDLLESEDLRADIEAEGRTPLRREPRPRWHGAGGGPNILDSACSIVLCNMHILLAYDGSDPAREALSVALEQFDPDQLTALYVFDPGEAGYDAPDPFRSDNDLRSLARERAATTLEEVEATVEDGIELQTAQETGHPARMIVRYAEEHDVDHVVVGSHGREGLSRLLLGSVAEMVVRRSPVSVTVAR